MADKRCENGHFIDESWDLCPYCPRSQQVHSTRAASSAARSAPHPTAAPPERSGIRLVDPPAAAALPSRTVAVPRPDSSSEPEPQRFVVAWLVGLNGVSKGESFSIRMGRNIIGRSSKSDVVIVDDQASGHHADLIYRPEEKRYILMDHNSTNGTFVNGQEIAPRRDLAARDIIRVGKQKFMFIPLVGDSFSWNDGEIS